MGPEDTTEDLGLSHVAGVPQRTSCTVRGPQRQETVSCQSSITRRSWGRSGGGEFSMREPCRGISGKAVLQRGGVARPASSALQNYLLLSDIQLDCTSKPLAVVCGPVTELWPTGCELKRCMTLLGLVHKDHPLVFLHVFSLFWLSGHGDLKPHIKDGRAFFSLGP